MADFCHPHSPLSRGRLPRHQLIFEVNFNHFPHQAIGSAAHGGNLLQNGPCLTSASSPTALTWCF